jgi:hypothetical protein
MQQVVRPLEFSGKDRDVVRSLTRHVYISVVF